MNYQDLKNSIQELLDTALMETDDIEEKLSIINDFIEACDDSYDYTLELQSELEEELENAEPTPHILNDNNYEEDGTPILDFLELIKG